MIVCSIAVFLVLFMFFMGTIWNGKKEIVGKIDRIEFGEGKYADDKIYFQDGRVIRCVIVDDNTVERDKKARVTKTGQFLSAYDYCKIFEE